MSITAEVTQNLCRIRAAGELTMASACELKAHLVDASSARRDLDLDLDCVEDIDITAVQLLWAAAREASRDGRRVAGRFSQAALGVLRDTGLDSLLADGAADQQACVLCEPLE